MARMAKQRRWRRHTREFKRQAVERMKTAENIRALARELDIQQKLLYSSTNSKGVPNRGTPAGQLPQKNAKINNSARRSPS